jgi:asparagine synthase (glutamine-hydrolysing)
MCGISGFLASDAAMAAPVATVRRMNDALVHRGPDAEGVWTHGPCALGHRRLSIIDLSPEARQPLLNEDETVAVVVNGEIYNFQSIRDELVAKGHTFRSHSDSEVVLHLYEEVGERFVERLDGMFALGLYDTKNRRLILARDRSGKKPLYYRATREGLAFASEVHALITAFPDEPPEVDYAAIDDYLTAAYVPAPHTAYKNIWKLPAAHALVCSPGRRDEPRRYWRLARHPEVKGSDEELARELKRLLTRAVERRMVADVPLGAFLSGGIDSSTVVALMAGLSTRPVKTFSIGFEHADYTEVEYARMVAERYRTDHRELVVTADMATVVHDIVRHHGEPFADSSAVATYYLAKMTREHVTVSLSGDGGDENLAGYRRYNTARIGHAYDRVPDALKGAFQKGLALGAGVLYPWVGRFARHLHEGEAARYLLLVGQFSAEDKAALYGPALRPVASDRMRRRFEEILAQSDGRFAMARLLDVDFETYLTDDIHAKVDIASMSHALEVRCPFLDTDVVEFCARLPMRALMRTRGKHVLREAVRDLLPAPILTRGKMGFGIPLDHWMRRDLRETLREALLGKTARERGLFDMKYIERLVATVDTANPEMYRLWTLLMLELWFREFIDRPVARAS